MNARSVVVLVVVVGIAAASYAFRGDSLDRNIKAAVVELNKTLPKMIDSVTRGDSVEATHHGITYNCTIIGALGNNLTSEQKTAMEGAVRAGWKTNPEMRSKVMDGVTVRYVYHNDSGATVMDFTVSKADM